MQWDLHELDWGGWVVYDVRSSGHSLVIESSRDSSETETIPYVESVHHTYLDLVPPSHFPVAFSKHNRWCSDCTCFAKKNS
jgi:hypothetical protein